MTALQSLYARLPGITPLLDHPTLADAIAVHGHSAVRDAAREQLDHARVHIRRHDALPDWATDPAALAGRIAAAAQASQRLALRPVFNLTGTVLHTNLGRAL